MRSPSPFFKAIRAHTTMTTRTHPQFFVAFRGRDVGLFHLSEQMPYVRENSIFKVHNATMNEQSPLLRMKEERNTMHPTKYEILVLPPTGGLPFLTAYWYTQYKVFSTLLEEWLPVLDFSLRSCIPSVYEYRIAGDTDEKFMQRQSYMEALRTSFLQTPAPIGRRAPIATHHAFPIPASVEPPPPIRRQRSQSEPKPQPQKIPVFVAEALKRDAISRGDTCPVSMTPFTASTPITILSCFHMFMKEAADEWFKRRDECPCCKAPITNTVNV